VLALAAAVAAVDAAVIFASGRVVYAPGFLAVWLSLGIGAIAVAAARARARARRYSIGADIEDDAFSSVPLWLVHRAKGAYHLKLVPGMRGRIDGGPSPILVESLVQHTAGREVSLPLSAGARIEVSFETGTFVVSAPDGAGASTSLPRGFGRRYARRSLLPVEVAVVASVVLAVPMTGRLSDADLKSAIPANATPWEVEKMLRSEAQLQARTLHQCFDVLPVECQHPGYVGVGLSLSRQGEIRSRWIARSTYGHDCPVDQCMSDVIGTWFFEPLPESIHVVLPVQVLRTDRPLPIGAEREATNAARRVAAAARNNVD